ncbi:MAG TPA: hypothetical protein VKE88_03770 [Candidatus Nanoarchaeia archaeon]|nr:hypothetical protein [Candidatus Nanoarchaeia archaeon]
MARGIIYTLAFLLLVTTTYAAYFPQPDVYFEFRQSTCINGSIIANITHLGKSLKFTDIIMTVEGDKLPKQELTGSWYVGGYPSSNYGYPAGNYTGHDFVTTTRFEFKSLPRIYTTGEYKVHVEWPSSSLYYDNIQFSVSCPGISCATNDDCISQQACGAQNTCEWLDCSDQEYAMGHRCFSQCDDQNVCTKDFYIDNGCINTELEGCCTNDNQCGAGSCQENKCVSAFKTTVQKLNIFQKVWNWLQNL